MELTTFIETGLPYALTSVYLAKLNMYAAERGYYRNPTRLKGAAKILQGIARPCGGECNFCARVHNIYNSPDAFKLILLPTPLDLLYAAYKVRKENP